MSSVKLLKLRDYLTIREATDYLAGITGTRYSRVGGQVLALVNEKKLFLYKNETPSDDYRDKVMYTLAQIANGKVPEGDVYHVKRKEIDALLESLHAKSASQTDQTKLEKQMQEKIDVLSAKIEQLESENLELKEENKELEEQLEPKPTPSTYTIAGALIELLLGKNELLDEETLKKIVMKRYRYDTNIKDEIVDKYDRCSSGSLNNFFTEANKALKASKTKG